MESSASLNYYLQVVKSDEKPDWPRPEEELIVSHQEIGEGYLQYWAYPKESGKNPGDLPEAEIVASGTSVDHQVLLIDQNSNNTQDSEGSLELIVVKNGHAWAKTQSSLQNLEDNITSILDFVKQKFNISIEHFMTTDRVSTEVEEKLNNLEKGENGTEPEGQPIKPVNSNLNSSSTSQPVLQTSTGMWLTKLKVILPVLLVVVLFLGIILFKDKILVKLNFNQQTGPTPTPTLIVEPSLTPTPTLSLDRSRLKVRILNGTTATGAAGNLADDLKSKGWVILSTGNATSSAVLQSYVRAKDGLDTAISVMISDLTGKYEVASSSALLSSDKADVEVVIGKK